MEEKRSFAFRRMEYMDGTLLSCGYVLTADGELRKPDQRIPNYSYSEPSQLIFTEIWDEVADDEVAISWEWRHGRYYFTNAILPSSVTGQQIATSKRLYQEVIKFRVDDIDWADMETWRRTPTSAPGWELERKPMPTDEELRRTVNEVFARSEEIPNLPGERFCACLIHKEGDGSYLQIEENFGKCTLEPLLPSSVDRLLQLERDYLCHYAVVTHRQSMRKTYVPLYEKYRAVVEGHGGQMIDVGADGFCITRHGTPEIYGLNGEDYPLFQQYCEALE